jgi:hypothetical protein
MIQAYQESQENKAYTLGTSVVYPSIISFSVSTVICQLAGSNA